MCICCCCCWMITAWTKKRTQRESQRGQKEDKAERITKVLKNQNEHLFEPACVAITENAAAVWIAEACAKFSQGWTCGRITEEFSKDLSTWRLMQKKSPSLSAKAHSNRRCRSWISCGLHPESRSRRTVQKTHLCKKTSRSQS